MRKIYPLLAIFIFAACHNDVDNGDSADAAPVDVDASVQLTEDEQIMLGYEADVVAYQTEIGMLPEWGSWMLEVGEDENVPLGSRKDWWSMAYINGRHDHQVKVYVRYENPVPYNPPWTSEAEHFAALKRLAELQYPGWTFTFLEYEQGMNAENLPDHDIVATLGGSGISFATGHNIYLVYETIFAHEFGHTLGLHHHYCNNTGNDQCRQLYPPGEGPCIMDRNSVSFGPTENTFLLLTTGERNDAEIRAAVANINNRYPGSHFAPVEWDKCGVED